MKKTKENPFHKKYPLSKIIYAYLIIIFYTLVVSIASIWTFTFTLVPLFRGLTPVLVFLIIPLFYILAYVYINKKGGINYDRLNDSQKYRFDLVKQIIIYIIIMLLLFFVFLIYLYFPMQKQGINMGPLNLTIQPYTFENQSYLYSTENFTKTEYIYSKYNLTVSILDPIEFNRTIDENYTRLIFAQNCTSVEEVFNLTNYSDTKTIKLVLLEFNGSVKGMAHICGKGNLAIVTLNDSMSGWVLAHELGHVLGAEKECWRFNLMKEYSKECSEANWISHNFIREMQPDFLNQKQVDIIVGSTKSRFS